MLTRRYGSHLSNAKDLRSFGQKLTELEQFLFKLADLSEIRDLEIGYADQAIFVFGGSGRVYIMVQNKQFGYCWVISGGKIRRIGHIRVSVGDFSDI